MPELPDVEINRRYLAATALHQPIEAVRVGAEKNRKVLDGVSAQQLGKAVAGQAFVDTRRHGKFCFAELGGGGHLVFHFGMTGFLRYYRREPEDLSHVRVRFDFSNGYHLAFANQRLLGSVAVSSDPQAFVSEKQLGPDALDGLSEEKFQALVQATNAKIKSLLTDQRKIAGIGNVYADEILFQAGIYPTTAANLLDAGERRRLFAAIGQVLNAAIDARTDPERMPDSYLLPVRREGEKCPRCGDDLKKLKLQGRATYCCPACQRG